MKENIVLNDYPHSSGVYYFISNNEVIYVGSSKNLYRRMKEHKEYVKKGSNHSRQKDLYQFLQQNQFTVEFQLSDNYKELEQELLEKHQPKYNSHRANTGLGAKTGNEAEYMKEYDKKYKDELKQQQKQYNNQLCNYNGENLTFCALRKRFAKKGIEHPTLEAKKYLIK